MKNKAFTLVELLGVIVILGILGIVIIPKVGDSITNSKETALLTQEEQIKKAAHDFLIDNIELLEKTDRITIKLGVLKQKGYLPINIKNPKTRKNISNESVITITKIGNEYDIQLNLIDLEDVTENIDNNSPIIVLNGDYVEYVEVNTLYQEKGATAKTSTGQKINNISIQIKLNNEEQTNIDTSQMQTYNIIYSATDENGKTTSATRTVIVRDSTAPTITVPTETTLHSSEVATFDIMDGVSISDNYYSNVNLNINSSLAALPGNYVITYTATDSSGNATTERRVINVNNDWSKYYTNVEYIESTGTQYIDTDVKPNSNTRIDIDFSFSGASLASPNWIPLFGVRTSSSGVGYGLFINKNILKISPNYYGFDPGFSSEVYINNETIYNLKNEGGQFYIDGTLQPSISTTTTLPSSPYSFYLFDLNNYGTRLNRGLKAKIYSVKIYDGNSLIRNMIPCVRNSDNIAGLYDMVDNKFYTNPGTNNFKYKKSNENITYTKLEYIESTGTQYINTGVKPNGNTKIDIDFSYIGTSVSNFKSWVPLFGTRTKDRTKQYALFIKESDQKVATNYGTFDAGESSSTYITKNSRHNIKNEGGQFYLDNDLESSISTLETMTQMNENLFLFTFLSDDVLTNARGTLAKIYSLKIYEGTTLIRNFIPAMRNSDNEVGLYDLVNEVFYTNAGTGSFNAGNPIN